MKPGDNERRLREDRRSEDTLSQRQYRLCRDTWCGLRTPLKAAVLGQQCPVYLEAA